MNISDKPVNHCGNIKLICTECDEGTQMEMVCYGGTPYEIDKTCSACCGEFEIELSKAEYTVLLLTDAIPVCYTMCHDNNTTS